MAMQPVFTGGIIVTLMTMPIVMVFVWYLTQGEMPPTGVLTDIILVEVSVMLAFTLIVWAVFRPKKST